MATYSNLGPTQGPILLGKNYEFWSLRMKYFLQAQERWDISDFGKLRDREIRRPGLGERNR